MSRRLLFFAAIAALTTAAPGLALAAASSAPEGPAWWRISDADSEVWIIGTPDELPIDTRWNDRTLRSRMQGAVQVIVPPVRTQFRPNFLGTRHPIVWKTLAQRLPDYRRISEHLHRARNLLASQGYYTSRNGWISAFDKVPTYHVANALTVGSMRYEKIGYPVRSRARQYGAREGASVLTVQSGSAALPGYLAYVALPEEEQVACVQKVDNAFTRGALTLRSHQAAIAAWARGDVQRSLVFYNYAHSCPYGQLGSAFWDRVVSDNVKAIQDSLAIPGKTVAVIELQPLLMKNGVVERLEAAGTRVEGERVRPATVVSFAV